MTFLPEVTKFRDPGVAGNGKAHPRKRVGSVTIFNFTSI